MRSLKTAPSILSYPVTGDFDIADEWQFRCADNRIAVKGCGNGDFFTFKHVAFRNGTQGVSFLDNIGDIEFGNIFADYFKLKVILTVVITDRDPARTFEKHGVD